MRAPKIAQPAPIVYRWADAVPQPLAIFGAEWYGWLCPICGTRGLNPFDHRGNARISGVAHIKRFHDGP